MYNPKHADEPGDVEIDDKIAPLQTHCHCGAVISVNDPGVFGESVLQEIVKLVGALGYPTLTPEKFVQMNHREAGQRAEAAGEGCFSAAGTAEDEDAFVLHALSPLC